MSEKIIGRIVKGVGGFYYVDTKDGIIECRARGNFRKAGLKPLVGDMAEVILEPDGRLSAIGSILPRKNSLIRPNVANVTQMAVVLAPINPKPDLYTLDKLIAAAEHAEAEIVICINKTDLDDGLDLIETYKKCGFDVIPLSAAENTNIDILKEKLKDNVTVFAGNSGVGKSSLMNCLLGSDTFETGEVNTRIERGRHTTRHSELVVLPSGGYLIDTPGFSSFTLDDVTKEELPDLFREFYDYQNDCMFRNCSHTVEKGCSILAAAEEGRIPMSRHESYVRLFKEIEDKKEW